MVEIRQAFSSIAEWRQFRDSLSEVATLNASVLANVRSNGYEEPLTGFRRKPEEIKITPGNLHESISVSELNSRKRALLLQFWNEICVRNWQRRKDLRILSASGLTRLALILRGRYPFFYTGEYLPSEKARKHLFPIPHLDLHTLDLPDESFDLFISDDVFEHLPFLGKALREIYRVLKPGGAVISSFPFVANREATLAKASLSETGEITYHEPPEYHASLVGDGNGALVFQLPGWDILDQLKADGFDDAYFTMLVSSHYGVASDGTPGPFMLTATKTVAANRPRKRPPDYVLRRALPEKLCALVALPRSGTTVITSVFSVHSRFVALFEPWNSAREFDKLKPNLDALSQHAQLPDLKDKILFVKETAARQEYIVNMRQLVDAAPSFISKHVLVALRSPAQTFMSEVSRRNEWWDANVPLNRETFKHWVVRSRHSLRLIIQLATQYDGAVIALGAFASHPDKILEKLGRQIGFSVEPAQLEYEKHVDLKIVRGDQNVGRAPAPIDPAKVNFRDQEAKIIQPFLTEAGEKRWFDAFQSFYELVEASGGVMAMSALTAELRTALTTAD